MNLSRYSRYLRPAVQAFFFIVFILIFISLAYPAAMPLSNPLIAMDPLVALASILFYRGSLDPFFCICGRAAGGKRDPGARFLRVGLPGRAGGRHFRQAFA